MTTTATRATAAGIAKKQKKRNKQKLGQGIRREAGRQETGDGAKQRAAKWLMFSKLLNFWPKLAEHEQSARSVKDVGGRGAWPPGHKKIKQARGVLIYGQQICSANVELRPRPKNSTRGTKRQGQVPRAGGQGWWCGG